MNQNRADLEIPNESRLQGLGIKPRCRQKEPTRKVPRSIHEGTRDMARQIAKSWEGCRSRRLRKKVEMLFAHLKRILKLDRLRLAALQPPYHVFKIDHELVGPGDILFELFDVGARKFGRQNAGRLGDHLYHCCIF
jgi:hypothetical protein